MNAFIEIDVFTLDVPVANWLLFSKLISMEKSSVFIIGFLNIMKMLACSLISYNLHAYISTQ